MVGDLETCVFTHSLYLGNELSHSSFEHEFSRYVSVENDGHIEVALRRKTALIDNADENIFLAERDDLTVDDGFENAVLRSLYYLLGMLVTAKIAADSAEQFSVFWSESLELRLYLIAYEFARLSYDLYLFYIKLVFDKSQYLFVVDLPVSTDIYLLERLSDRKSVV